MFRHPKYYKELRKRNKLAQVISKEASTEVTSVHPGPGKLKPQAASSKLQAPSWSKNKPQASSPKQQASSFKPQESSALIPEPGNGKVSRTRTKGLDQDKTILWMLHMEGNLMWAEAYLVTLRNF